MSNSQGGTRVSCMPSESCCPWRLTRCIRSQGSRPGTSATPCGPTAQDRAYVGFPQPHRAIGCARSQPLPVVTPSESADGGSMSRQHGAWRAVATPESDRHVIAPRRQQMTVGMPMPQPLRSRHARAELTHRFLRCSGCGPCDPNSARPTASHRDSTRVLPPGRDIHRAIVPDVPEDQGSGALFWCYLARQIASWLHLG